MNHLKARPVVCLLPVNVFCLFVCFSLLLLPRCRMCISECMCEIPRNQGHRVALEHQNAFPETITITKCTYLSGQAVVRQHSHFKRVRMFFFSSSEKDGEAKTLKVTRGLHCFLSQPLHIATK